MLVPWAGGATVAHLHGMEGVESSNLFRSTTGLKFNWLNTSFALRRQAGRPRPGPPLKLFNNRLFNGLQTSTSVAGNSQNLNLIFLENSLDFFDPAFPN